MYSLSQQKRMALIHPLIRLLDDTEIATIEDVNDDDPDGWPFSGWSVRINNRPVVFTFNGGRCQAEFEDTFESPIEFYYNLADWYSRCEQIPSSNNGECGSVDIWDTGASSVMAVADAGDFETKSIVRNFRFHPSASKTKFKVEITREMVDFNEMVWPENACLGNATLHIFLALNLMHGTWNTGTAIQLTNIHRISGENREVATYTTQRGRMRAVVQPRSDYWKMNIALDDQRGEYRIYRNPINDCLELCNENWLDESLQLDFTDTGTIRVGYQGSDLGRYTIGLCGNGIAAIRTH